MMNTATILRPFTCLGAALLFGPWSLGCALESQADPGESQADPGEESVGEAAAAVTSIGRATWGTTTDPLGLYTSWPYDDTHSCFLNSVAGNLTLGSSADWYGASTASNLQSEASVLSTDIFWNGPGNYRVRGHGGAYTQANYDSYGRVVSYSQAWYNNPVLAGATCVAHPAAPSLPSTGVWNSHSSAAVTSLGIFGQNISVSSSAFVGSPVFITPDTTTLNWAPVSTQCFIEAIYGNGLQLSRSYSYARVENITTTDATHPVTGWYVDSNAPNDVSGTNSEVIAKCVRFPQPTGFVSVVLSAPAGSPVSQAITPAGAGWACGLQEIKGAFDKNSFSDGVILSQATSTSPWTMTVSNGKSAHAVCVN
jgi:hypothetical protein